MVQATSPAQDRVARAASAVPCTPRTIAASAVRRGAPSVDAALREVALWRSPRAGRTQARAVRWRAGHTGCTTRGISQELVYAPSYIGNDPRDRDGTGCTAAGNATGCRAATGGEA